MTHLHFLAVLYYLQLQTLMYVFGVPSPSEDTWWYSQEWSQDRLEECGHKRTHGICVAFMFTLIHFLPICKGVLQLCLPAFSPIRAFVCVHVCVWN